MPKPILSSRPLSEALALIESNKGVLLLASGSCGSGRSTTLNQIYDAAVARGLSGYKVESTILLKSGFNVEAICAEIVSSGASLVAFDERAWEFEIRNSETVEIVLNLLSKGINVLGQIHSSKGQEANRLLSMMLAGVPGSITSKELVGFDIYSMSHVREGTDVLVEKPISIFPELRRYTVDSGKVVSWDSGEYVRFNDIAHLIPAIYRPAASLRS